MGAKTFRQAAGARPRASGELRVMKSDDEKRLVFGWASVAARVGGEQVVDYQDDAIDPEDLEEAAYRYVAEFGDSGEMHRRGGVGHVVESMVFTKEKADALGIPEGILPQGWWVGFRITDDEVWEKVKAGEYSMFSIEGTATREPMAEGGDG